MPDDKKTKQPPANTSEPSSMIPPNAGLHQEEIVQLPAGYQKIHLRPLVPKAAMDVLLVRNNIFESTENAGGCGKPISKIVEWREDTGRTSGK
jgi:hypothetical protein